MADLHGFDANDIEPTRDFEPLPAGKYLAVITDSEMKPTKSGNGHYLELIFQVIDGPHRSRRLWARLNLDNPNPTAVEIARGELSAICRAVGVMQPGDSAVLHDRPLLITVRCRTQERTGELVNEVRGYAKADAANGIPQQQTTNAPPWSR